MSNHKKIIIIAVIVVISALALTISGLKKDSSVSMSEQTTTATTEVSTQKEAIKSEESSSKTETKKTEKSVSSSDMKVRFMYYVSEADENKDEALKVVDELKSEYSKIIDFVVINIDKEPEKVYGFALPDETPKLVLIGINGEFSMKNNCADKNVLKQEIENVLKPQ